MTEPWRPALQAWLHLHLGVITVKALIGFGCSHRNVYRLVESGEFAIISSGVLRSTHWPLGPEQLMMAACLRNDDAVIAGPAAARAWKWRSLPADDGEVKVLIPHGTSMRMPGVTIEKCRLIDPVDIVEWNDGRRFTSPSRTLFDCADGFGRKRTGSIFEQLLNDSKLTYATHASTVARLGSPGRPGTRTMRLVLESRPAWRAAVQSELELLVLNEIELQGLPTPEVQYWFRFPNGKRVRFDFAWPSHTAVLEVDHPFWHAGVEASHRDKNRDLDMGAIGWQTMRITDLNVNVGLPIAIAKVAATLDLRPRTL